MSPRVAITILLAGCAATAIALVAGQMSWTRRSASLRREIAPPARPAATLDTAELVGLPAPVARMLRVTLTPGQRLIASLEMQHRGTFDLGRGSPRWAPFTSNQWVAVSPPGFLWDARIRMGAGVPVFVHDAFVTGRGVLTAKLFGLITVMHAEPDAALAQGEFLRWVAEAAWYPTALLPSQGAVWEARDDSTAALTLRANDRRATVVVTFGQDGRIARVRADERARVTPDGPVMTPWEGRFWNYAQQDGMWIPRQGEVAWVLPDGPHPYWRGQLVRAVYTFAR